MRDVLPSCTNIDMVFFHQDVGISFCKKTTLDALLHLLVSGFYYYCCFLDLSHSWVSIQMELRKTSATIYISLNYLAGGTIVRR